jgi:hypothetical protein
MNVESVCTDDELDDYLQGQLKAQIKLLPVGQTDATKQRTQALDDVLTALSRRTPPIREADLAVPAELKRAVKYGAEMWLLYHGLTNASPESALFFRYTQAKKRFDAEIEGLTPTLTGGFRGNSSGYAVSRR